MCLDHLAISDTEVLEVLISLDTNKAKGIDGIGPNILKYCSSALYIPLHYLFSLTLSQNSLPKEWLLHLVTPIHKSGDRTQVNNYRPISLLCTTSKVLERIIYNKTIDFVLHSISNTQFGFLPNRSTLQQLLLFLSQIHSCLTNKNQLDVLYLDFRKAFDSVSFNELLLKLWKIGITGNLWKWFKAYLSSRSQCVSINGCISSFLPVTSGVPQGSILGPMLFLVFINDLPPSAIHSRLLLYADDVKCSHPINTLDDCKQLQHDLNTLSTWSIEWNLNFNVSKCALLRFCSHSKVYPSVYSKKSTSISSKSSVRDLGVTVSSNLSWTQHYDLISTSSYKSLGLIRRTFGQSTSLKAKKLLYITLVRSHLLYCSPVWRPNLIKDITRLEKIQRRATKFILNDYISSYRSRLISLHLLPLMMLFELNDLTFFIKCIKTNPTHFPIQKFVQFSSGTTRSSTSFKLKHHHSKSVHARHFYFNRLPRLWNVLPPIDISLSLKTITSQLKSIFWSHFISHFDSDAPCTFHYLCPCNRCSYLPHPNLYV